jgi:hypothetical protein
MIVVHLPCVIIKSKCCTMKNVEPLTYYLYIFMNDTLVLQYNYNEAKKAEIQIYERDEVVPNTVDCEQVIRKRQEGSCSFKYQNVIILFDKKRNRICRHICSLPIVIDTQPPSTWKRFDVKKSYVDKESGQSWTMQHPFFQSLNVTSGRAMELYVHEFLSSRHGPYSYEAFLSEMVRFGHENVWFYKDDYDFIRGKSNDYCDPSIESNGAGDCEDSSHFMIRFIKTLTEIGHCENIRRLCGYHRHLLFCMTKNNICHCIIVLVPKQSPTLDTLIFVDSTNPDDGVFVGYEMYKAKFGRCLFTVSNLHISSVFKNTNALEFFSPDEDF